jgi:hypothetical protein
MAVIFIGPPCPCFTFILGSRQFHVASANLGFLPDRAVLKRNDTLREVFLQELFNGGCSQISVWRLKPHRSIDFITHIGYPFLLVAVCEG